MAEGVVYFELESVNRWMVVYWIWIRDLLNFVLDKSKKEKKSLEEGKKLKKKKQSVLQVFTSFYILCFCPIICLLVEICNQC